MDFGKRLLPHVVDQAAQNSPLEEAFQIPRSSDVQDGWEVITVGEFANAINGCAHHIIRTCGPPAKGTIPTIAYIGPNDARCLVVFLACIKAGYKALLTSPRNSEEAHLKLFADTDCRFVAYTELFEESVQVWCQKREMTPIKIALVKDCFSAKEHPHFPYTKTYKQSELETAVVLHTSGSTGLPKPIEITHGLLAIIDNYHNIGKIRGYELVYHTLTEKSKRTFHPMPLFHAGGLMFASIYIFWQTPFVLSMGERPLSVDLAYECLTRLDIESALLPPAILEDMSHNEAHLGALKKCNFVVTFGGNISREAGDRLTDNGVVLINFISATETGLYPIFFQPNPELWHYFIFDDDIFGAEWRKASETEEVYELFIVRKHNPLSKQGIFYTFPDATEYSTKDLYKPHPTLPNHWTYYGRTDNIIVLSTGEKLNPVTIEDTITGHAEVKGALVIGSGKFQAGLIIEPTTNPRNEAEAKKLIDSIWLAISKINKDTVAHGRIAPELILLSNPNKPFFRAGKGTVQREATISAYRAEIENLYRTVGESSKVKVPPVDVSSEESLIQSIQAMFEQRLYAGNIKPDAQFFSAGVDSLQTIEAAKLLRAALEAKGYHADGSNMAPRVIYNNPTPRKLAYYIRKIIIDGDGAIEESGEEPHCLETMKHLWEKYTTDLLQGKASRPNALDKKQTVILTGSTGMLGSYLLDFMVKSPMVERIVCLNRASDGGASQQARAAKDRGLLEDFRGKAKFYQADLSQPKLGLSDSVFAALLKETDRFIHNAWPVNFNIPIETFEPQILGVRNIADFAAKSAKRVAVAFISSVAAAEYWDQSRETIPEERLDDLRYSNGGYGSSKLVGSLVFDDASKAGDFPLAVFRVGQIAGPEASSGAWNQNEWFPSIVASSLYLKALPSDLATKNRIDWVPVERIAKLVLEVTGITQLVNPKDIGGYYHGTNPSATTWDAIAPVIQGYYGKKRISEVIPFTEWIARLEQSWSDEAEVIAHNPGIKLLDSYQAMAADAKAGRGMRRFSVERTMAKSPTMARSEAVTSKLMQNWCKQWGFEKNLV